MWQLRKRKPKDPALGSDQLSLDYRIVFGSEAGRRVLWDILDRCSMFNCDIQAPFSGLSSVVLFNEGRRSVAVGILEKLEVRNIEELQEYAET